MGPSAKFVHEHKQWEKKLVDMLNSQKKWNAKEPAIRVPEDMDVDGVSNIEDAHKGGPLYAHYAFEDWVIFQLRFQIHLLLHAFRRDAGEPVHHTCFAFYYYVFFENRFEEANFGQDSFEGVFNLI